MSAKGVAFFPWWPLAQKRDIGPIRLVPYERGQKPGDSASATQVDIDAILHAYSLRPSNRINQATLVEVDDWQIGDDPYPVLNRLFTAREAIGFSALSKRQLFLRNNLNYCNFDNFILVTQLYRAGQAHQLVYNTRRRDGITQNLWSSEDIKIQRPDHIHNVSNIDIDEALAALLMENVPDHWSDAISEFNRANTDSSDTTEHVELVKMKSAFEWLLEIGNKRSEFAEALQNVLPPPSEEVELHPMWRRFAQQPSRPILAWAADFCDRRGAAAHGANRQAGRFAWSASSHLAFCSMFFPLLFKKIAANANMYALSNIDLERLRNIDRFANADPFGDEAEKSFQSYEVPHPWPSIDEDLHQKEAHRKIMKMLEEHDVFRNFPNDNPGQAESMQ